MTLMESHILSLLWRVITSVYDHYMSACYVFVASTYQYIHINNENPTNHLNLQVFNCHCTAYIVVWMEVMTGRGYFVVHQ